MCEDNPKYMTPSKLSGLSYFLCGQDYIGAAKTIIDETIMRENPIVAFGDHDIDEIELLDQTKYSSSSIILPAMFCYYQGVELLLKGFLYHTGKVSRIHKTEDLFDAFVDHYSGIHEAQDLIALFENHIHGMPDFILNYVKVNGIEDIHSLYSSLRYPDIIGVRNGQCYNYFSLKYPGEHFVDELTVLSQKIVLLLKHSVSLYRSIEMKL